MWPVGHFVNYKKQAQPFLLFLRKYSFSWNQIRGRVYTDIEVSKYYNIYLGKVICWPRVLKMYKM